MIRRQTLGLVVGTALLLASCATTTSPAPTPTPSSSPSAVPSGPPPTPATACAPAVTLGVLPEWAREGFSEPEPTALQALGRSGDIIAILFGGTLYALPSTEVSNKVLWVAREPAPFAGDLVIRAQRMDGAEPLGEPVERTVDGGPCPSTVDLPEAGC